MREVIMLIKQLKQDEDGAALIEYTVLLAILLIAVIAIIGGVGAWTWAGGPTSMGNLPLYLGTALWEVHPLCRSTPRRLTQCSTPPPLCTAACIFFIDQRIRG